MLGNANDRIDILYLENRYNISTNCGIATLVREGTMQRSGLSTEVAMRQPQGSWYRLLAESHSLDIGIVSEAHTAALFMLHRRSGVRLIGDLSRAAD